MSIISKSNENGLILRLIKNNQKMIKKSTIEKIRKRLIEIQTLPYIHIIPSHNRWCVKRSGRRKALRIFKYKEVAFLYANAIAKDNELIIIHKETGGMLFKTKKLLVGQTINLYTNLIKKL
jgi:hypothetical protein